jgi:hypothetical protein
MAAAADETKIFRYGSRIMTRSMERRRWGSSSKKRTTGGRGASVLIGPFKLNGVGFMVESFNYPRFRFVQVRIGAFVFGHLIQQGVAIVGAPDISIGDMQQGEEELVLFG